MQKDEFFQKAIAFLKETYKNSRFEPKDPNTLEVDYYENAETKSPKHLYLNMPYEYSQKENFADWEGAVKEYFERLISVKTDFDNDTWESVRDIILPQIKRKDQMDYFRQKFPDAKHAPVYETFIGDLVIGYVLDQPKGFVYISDDMLGKWGVSLEEVGKKAIVNLQNLPASKMEPKAVGNGDGTLSYYYDANDGYDAARILLNSFHNFLGQKFNGSYVVSIPHRDRVFATPMHMEKKLAEISKNQYEHSSHPITPSVIKYTPKFS